MNMTTIKPFPRRSAQPAIEPVTLAEALIQCKEVSDGGGPIDQAITRMIKAAREFCEQRTERTLITTAWRLRLDAFPVGGAIELLQPPIISVGSVAYLDADGVSRLSNPGDYVVDTASEPGWLVPAPGKTWPTTQDGAINAVTIDYTAGHGPATANIPEPLRLWILCAVQHMHDERGWDVPEEFAPGLINPYRLLGI